MGRIKKIYRFNVDFWECVEPKKKFKLNVDECIEIKSHKHLTQNQDCPRDKLNDDKRKIK